MRLLRNILLLVSFTAISSNAFGQSNPEVQSVDIGALSGGVCNPDNLPFLVASQNGYFTAEKLKVNLREGVKDGSSVDNFLIAGRAYFYGMEAATPGVFKLLVANVTDTEHPDYAVLVKKDGGVGVKGLKELGGKRLGVEPRSGRDRFMLASLILQAPGVKASQVDISDATVQDLADGKVDALYLRGPELREAMSLGRYSSIADAPVIKYVMNPWPMGFLAARGEYITGNPDVVKRVEAAWHKAIQFIRDNPQAARKIARECAATEFNARADREGAYAFWKLSEFKLDNLQKQVDLYYEHKLIPRKIRIEDMLAFR